MKKRDNSRKSNLFESTRIERTLPSLIIIILAMAIAENTSLLLMSLALSLVLVYSALSIDNALRDKDYHLPSYSNKIVIILLILAFIISLVNPIITASFLLWTTLGFLYNTYSRKIPLADTTIISLTHYTIPLLASLLILGRELDFSIKLSLLIFLIFWFLTPIKNTKGIKEDKERGYKTLTTVSKSGKKITLCCFLFSLMLMLLAYFILGLSAIYVAILIPIVYLGCLTINNVLNGKDDTLKLVRVIIILFLIGLVVGLTSNLQYLVYSLSILLIYLAISIPKFRTKQNVQ